MGGLYGRRMDHVRISRFGLGEIDQVQRLWQEFRGHLGGVSHGAAMHEATRSWEIRRELYGRWLADPDALGLIAHDGEDAIGYTVVSLAPGPDDTWVTGPRIAEVQSLYVEPLFRGHRLGSRLMDTVDAHLAGIGVTDMQVGMMAADRDAIGFFLRRGLQPRRVYFSRYGVGHHPS